MLRIMYREFTSWQWTLFKDHLKEFWLSYCFCPIFWFQKISIPFPGKTLLFAPLTSQDFPFQGVFDDFENLKFTILPIKTDIPQAVAFLVFLGIALSIRESVLHLTNCQTLSQPKLLCNDSGVLNLHNSYYTMIMTSRSLFHYNPVSIMSHKSANQKIGIHTVYESWGVIHIVPRPRWITPSSICLILHILWKPNSLIALLFIQNNS